MAENSFLARVHYSMSFALQAKKDKNNNNNNVNNKVNN